jgi:uncharacterized protein
LVPATEVSPPPPARIATLDILRGFALLGMIFIHFHQRFRLTTEGGPRAFGEEAVGYIAWMGIEQKSWATFAFLFGVGFAVLMRSAERRGQPVIAFYLRRLAALAVVGVALDVFTGFAVLLEYAIWGVPLLLIRKWPTKVLLVVAVLSASAWMMPYFVPAVHQWVTLGREGADAAVAARKPPPPRVRQAPPQNYREVVARRWRGIVNRYSHWTAAFPSTSFTLFIIGLLAVRRGIFDDTLRHVKLIAIWMAIGLACWGAAWFVLPNLSFGFVPRSVAGFLQAGLGIINEQWLAFFYIGALVLLLAYRPIWTSRLAWFGIAGRMALTNYVLQCVIIEFLSSPFGLGLHPRPYLYALGSLILFSVAVAFSLAWMSRYRYGPLEWMWRSVTYWRVPPLAKA